MACDDNSVGGSSHVVDRLEEALEIQDTTEGEIATTPTVAYCFDCDEITVDTWVPDGCLEHRTVVSDGYEHGGIQAALTTLRYLQNAGGDES